MKFQEDSNSIQIQQWRIHACYPTNSLASQPQDDPKDARLPAKPVGTPHGMVEDKQPELMIQQPPTGENTIQPGVMIEIGSDMTNDKDKSNEGQPDMRNGNQPHMTIENPALWRTGNTVWPTVDSTLRGHQDHQLIACIQDPDKNSHFKTTQVVLGIVCTNFVLINYCNRVGALRHLPGAGQLHYLLISGVR
ncbi:hypothetical protein JOB18_024925 [Solea senegalensis]|uniref:Uncharacterized protein n=1 Tax=Solea senegalensis TaxID=28829 RepID=A0AAV6QMD4_SOLSE|nr:hypothetical protein JOB18_024925 [Solea senegalensis]